MAKTPENFYQEFNGKAIDADHAYGVQCVDGFRVFCNWAIGKSWPTGTGWADGYWYNRKQHSDQFIEVSKNNLRDGDWVFWARGSKSHPSSHVAMYYHGMEFGQNQGGNRGFCLKQTNFGDCLGGLRWKGWQTVQPKPQPAQKPAKKADNRKHNVAYSFSKAYKRTYTTTANLHMRKGWTTSDAIIVTIPKGGKVICFGYFTDAWLYCQATVKGKTYTGFCNKNYLK